VTPPKPEPAQRKTPSASTKGKTRTTSRRKRGATV
jgi:hypothetical protein